MKYVQTSPRRPVQYVDADTETILFEVHDRSWVNVNELLSAASVDKLLQGELKGKKLPRKVLVMAIGEFELKDE